MQCPHCQVPLAITERQGVEVDYCPQCRGVWLDRGELDKILERAARQFDAPPPQPQPQHQQHSQPYHAAPRGGQWDQGHHRHKKRKSFLEEVFDF